MDLLDDSCNDQLSVGSGCSFQVQLMRCGFLPQNSVSSFDIKDIDLEDLELKDEDADNQNEDHSEGTASTTDAGAASRSRSISPKPPARRGMLRTLSLRLSRRNLMGDGGNDGEEDEEEMIDSNTQHRRDSRGSKRNLGLKKRAERERGLDRSPMRRMKSA